MWLVDCWFSSTDADHTHSCQWAGLDQDTLSDSYHHMFGQISGKAWKQNTDQTKQVTKTKMNPDPRATELVDISVVAPQDPTSHQPTDHVNDQELGTEVVVWVPFGRRLISSLLGMNLVLLGVALVSAQIFNAEGLKHQEPQVFMLLLMVVGLIWMLWFLLWTRKQNKTSLHWDHHAGGTTVIGKSWSFGFTTVHVWLFLEVDFSFLCSISLFWTSGSGPFHCLQCGAVRLQVGLFDQCEGVSAGC